SPGKVSITADGWSSNTMKMGFLGMTAHWIEVKEKKWKLRAEVIGFKVLSGAYNTGNNNTTCKTIQEIHACRGLPEWNSAELQLPCLGHVINLANVEVMGHITKIAAVKNATAIWEYDPTREDNRVLGGSLDVIAAIRTLAIKIQVSGQCIEYFQSTQIRCGIPDPLKIPLHSNI
ncbi:hypothetical protein K443DRAFT_42213, partial [Laccaria amethystina LaAM-08-1]